MLDAMDGCNKHNKITAEAFFNSYRDALSVYEYLLDEEEMLKAKAENLKSASAIPSGWTGRYVTEDKNSVRMKEMVPLTGRSSSAGDSHELALIDFADQSEKVERARQKAIKTKNEIETIVNAALSLEDAIMIKRRYLLGQSINEIAAAMYCSTSTVSRRLRLAIEYLDSSLFALAIDNSSQNMQQMTSNDL